MKAYLIVHERKPVAVVYPDGKAILRKEFAPFFEKCLNAYSLFIAYGEDRRELTKFGRLDGWIVEPTIEATPEYMVRAIMVCLAFSLGVKGKIYEEELGEVYELKLPPRQTSVVKKSGEGEIEFEEI